MNIAELLLSGQNGANLVAQLAEQSGLKQQDMARIVSLLAPALTAGIRTNVANGGLNDLEQALKTGDHDRYINNPTALSEPAATEEGNAILGHVLGSKDRSRNLAYQTAQATGADESLIKKLLPLVATGVMGALSQQTNSADSVQPPSSQNSTLASTLTSLLDTDGDGSVADDLFDLAKKFF